jgi:SagB-type dehydrogenase family enzyme
VREFEDVALGDAEHGQLLWASQGITHRTMGLRTAPSAGALYPLEVYLVTKEGVFHYEPRAHQLRMTMSADVRNALSNAALRQESVGDAPSILVLAGVYERTAKKYGRARAERYVHLEAGHAAQNVLLQAVALGVVAVPIGAFQDDEVRQVLALPRTHRPLYLVPIGRPPRYRKHQIPPRIRQLPAITGNRILSYRNQTTAKSTFGKTLCGLANSNARPRREGRTWETCPPPRP